MRLKPCRVLKTIVRKCGHFVESVASPAGRSAWEFSCSSSSATPPPAVLHAGLALGAATLYVRRVSGSLRPERQRGSLGSGRQAPFMGPAREGKRFPARRSRLRFPGRSRTLRWHATAHRGTRQRSANVMLPLLAEADVKSRHYCEIVGSITS